MNDYNELIKRLRDIANWDWNGIDGEYVERTAKEAADAIEELSKPKWIPVTERLPESQGPFLTRYGFGDASIETGQFFYGVLYYLYADADPHWQHESVGVEVTHWMPLPQAPKEE